MGPVLCNYRSRIVIYSSQIFILTWGIYPTMAPNGKAFSSQIKRMSKKPLKYNPEEVMVIKVDMTQDVFNFAMDVARECMGKFKKEDEPGMAKHAVDRFNEEHGEHWMSDFHISPNRVFQFVILFTKCILDKI